MWCRYIDEVIAPFCSGHPATFVFDSANTHTRGVCADTAMEHNIYSVVVPKGATSTMQPNDVHRFAPPFPPSQGLDKGCMEEADARRAGVI